MLTSLPRYAKTVVAVVAAALMTLSPLLPVGSAARHWVDVGVAVIGAMAVLVVPNASATPPPDTSPTVQPLP